MAHLYATCLKVAVNKLAALQMRTAARDPLRSRIGMFHAVLPDGAPLPDEYACHLSDLTESIDAHIARGFRFVSLHALLAMPYAEAKSGCCVLTFDDGFSGIFDLVAPYLTARGIPLTLFITTGYLDTEGYLTGDELRALAENPLCTVGSHLVTHPMTRFLSKSAVLAELTESKRLLEAAVNKPVTDLAFPYGSAYACSLRDVRLARRVGYQSAALTTPTVYGRLLRRAYTLPRLDRFHI